MSRAAGEGVLRRSTRLQPGIKTKLIAQERYTLAVTACPKAKILLDETSRIGVSKKVVAAIHESLSLLGDVLHENVRA